MTVASIIAGAVFAVAAIHFLLGNDDLTPDDAVDESDK